MSGIATLIGPDTSRTDEPAHTTLKTRVDEGSEDYPALVAVLNPGWRVIVCRDGIQWILQHRHMRKGRARWDGNSYCQTRDALLRNIRERAGACDLAAIQYLSRLPEHIRDGEP
jgi:sulfur transfer complex TusBCD TusB component (DsrH family)